jgi:predicted transcriptional regulator
MKTKYSTYKGQPTNATRIIEYLKSTPFKQMAIKRIAADLDIDKEVCSSIISDMALRGQIKRSKIGRLSIVGLN